MVRDSAQYGSRERLLRLRRTAARARWALCQARLGLQTLAIAKSDGSVARRWGHRVCALGLVPHDEEEGLGTARQLLQPAERVGGDVAVGEGAHVARRHLPQSYNRRTRRPSRRSERKEKH